MELGTSLKNARMSCGLTQGEAADQIGISRQTLSNWENNHSYPDAVSLMSVSRLYGISLDALLKEDDTVSEQSELQAQAAKKKRCVLKWVEVGVYLGLASLIMLAFIPCAYMSGVWQIYALLVPRVVMPTLVAVFSVVIGADEKWGIEKWAMLPVGVFVCFSFFFVFAAVFGDASQIVLVIRLPLYWILGSACAGGGLLLGCGIKQIKRFLIKQAEK